MANKKPKQSFLTKDQIEMLVQVVIDEFGSDLPEEELVDAIALVLESLPGIEMESNQSIQCVIQQIRNQYYGNSTSKETS